MWRVAPNALLAALPNIPQFFHDGSRPEAPEKRDPPVLAASPKTTSTASAMPASM